VLVLVAVAVVVVVVVVVPPVPPVPLVVSPPQFAVAAAAIRAAVKTRGLQRFVIMRSSFVGVRDERRESVSRDFTGVGNEGGIPSIYLLISSTSAPSPPGARLLVHRRVAEPARAVLAECCPIVSDC
jgi:hypothetical protein